MSYILYSKGLRYSKALTRLYRRNQQAVTGTDSIRSAVRNGVANLVFACFWREAGVIFWRKNPTNLEKNPKLLAKMSVVRPILEIRQLGWESDAALEGVWAVPCSSRLPHIMANSYLLTPLHFPISKLLFPPRIQHKCLYSCICLNFAKCQPGFLNYQILNICRVL